MDNQVLQSFYNRMLPLYKPQAEKFLDSMEPALLNRIAFRYTFSVEAMVKISHIIEDAATANPNVADLHVSFQTLSRLEAQLDRYRHISQTVSGLWLYGQNDVPPDTFDFLSRSTVIDTADTLLTRYWFVIAYGPGLGMMLLAEEVSALAGEDRYYEGFYTFEQDMAYQILAILSQIYPQSVPKPVQPELLSE